MNRAGQIFQELGFDADAVRLPDSAVVYAIARTYSLIMRKLAQTYRRAGLSAAAFNLLVLLARGKDRHALTQRKIGQHLVVSPSDLSGLVDRLEARGLVRRAAGKDRRSKVVQITPKGAALVERVWPEHAGTIQQMTGAIGTQRVTALLDALGRMRTAVGV